MEPGLSDPKRGAPEAAGASFFLTNEAARAALPVPLLSLDVINLLAEIEPNNGVAGTMKLRLRFIAKRSERQGDGGRWHDDRHPKQKERAQSTAATPCAKFQRAVAGSGRLT